eukprot:CAMPEP_0181321428 /NCGR_PEP_ID=MMETSP1101-20121128/18677_1 /TAXON_ID=46948 /ORGANISM="Rhodomonas abbreviata, Strain Caron Lab Isolate" /LENGTH=344 /DNA_ID=CAMNT_0023429249 /DNA_START=84 /DNA_END=1115 /DNA_ORIENTATION=+
MDKDKNGKITVKELMLGLKDKKAAILNHDESTSLGRLVKMWDSDDKVVAIEEFADIMENFFESEYSQVFEAVDFAKILACALRESLTVGELQNECLHLHPFQHLKTLSPDECRELVSSMFDKVKDDVVKQTSALFSAAAKYEAQENAGRNTKFNDLKLGSPRLFDLGVEGVLGLPNFDFRKQVEKEHESEATFEAWNNDKKRTTSPAEQFKMVLPEGWGGKVNPWDYRREIKMSTDDAMEHANVAAAGLAKEEVVVAKLYTGPMYALYNGEMRQYLSKMEPRLENDDDVLKMSLDNLIKIAEETRKTFKMDSEGAEETSKTFKMEGGGRFTTTIQVLVSALLKL